MGGNTKCKRTFTPWRIWTLTLLPWLSAAAYLTAAKLGPDGWMIGSVAGVVF